MLDRRFAGGFIVTLLCSLWLVVSAPAQELRPHPQPLSAYLDLRPATAGTPAQTTPAWIEALEFTPGVKADSGVDVDTGSGLPKRRGVFRVRLQPPEGSTSDLLQARVFFQDLASGARPQVTLWNELGERLSQPFVLGQNLGLPSSETLTLPMHGVDYLEIEADADGSQIRGLFLGWLEATTVLQPSDFRSNEKVRQPFHILSAARKRKHDGYRYGVVTASLQSGAPIVLKPSQVASANFQFNLEKQPLMAVVTYEVLGAPIDAPPSLTVNGRAQGPSTLHLPELADPGFQGVAREAESQMGFRYTGWLPAQKVVPGDCLNAGLNNLSVGLSNGTDAVAIRAVSIQLKYDWEKLDYVLSPATTPTP